MMNMIILRNAIIRIETLNVGKILDFKKQQKSRGIKILTPKQMLQRLLIALTKVNSGNTSENLPNEIRQIIRSLC